MGGQNENSFSDSTSVDITVKENIWKAPEPVEIIENSTDPHPIKITQVRWNEPGAHYSLIEKEKLPTFPFSIDQKGDIYVTQPLDREEKGSYVFHVVAKDDLGIPLAFPLKIHVKVKDINDNPPTCPSTVTVFEVQENEKIGSNIGTLIANDTDEANTINSFLEYRIVIEKEKLPTFPFSIDQKGDIYVTQPLDREEKGSYVFHVVAKDDLGIPLAFPLKIHVKVKDINDNPPTCPSTVTVFEVQENEKIGSNIGTLIANDTDEANTINSFLEYRIVDQAPKSPTEGLFLVQAYTGVFQLAMQSLRKQDTPQYHLTVEVSDKDFKTLCHVQVNVIDINDQIPVFEKSDYGNLTLSEDAVIGSVILTIQATDDDEPFTGSSKILYRIIQGDNEGRLGIETDPQTNAGYVMIKKPLDFETASIHNISFHAENPEPLVPGVEYDARSFATFSLFVTNVDEAPQFSQQVFQAKVSEGVAVGTKLGNVTAKDPEGLDISYSLRGDTRGWLVIDPVTGEIFSVAPLDREAESLYRVQVVATEVGGSSMSSTANFHLTLTDVNDNPPRLVKEYTGLFFCYPLRKPGSVTFEATDDDQQSFRGLQFTFSLSSENLQKDWEVSKINGTHARLSTKHTGFEERVYNISIHINDGGRPPMEGTVFLPVTFCTCVEERCFQPAGRQPGMPTVGITVGILLATFLVIGIILAAVFIQMKNKDKDNVKSAQASEVKPLRNGN